MLNQLTVRQDFSAPIFGLLLCIAFASTGRTHIANVGATVKEFEAIGEDVDRFKAFVCVGGYGGSAAPCVIGGNITVVSLQSIVPRKDSHGRGIRVGLNKVGLNLLKRYVP